MAAGSTRHRGPVVRLIDDQRGDVVAEHGGQVSDEIPDVIHPPTIHHDNTSLAVDDVFQPKLAILEFVKFDIASEDDSGELVAATPDFAGLNRSQGDGAT